MCDVCCAELVLQTKGGAAFNWDNDPKAPKGRTIHVEAKGKGAEMKPCQVRIRRKGTTWSAWFKTGDLAGVMGALGTDVVWRIVGKRTKQYLEGKMPVRDLIAHIVDQQEKADALVRSIEKTAKRDWKKRGIYTGEV